MMLQWRKITMSYTADIYSSIARDIQNGANIPGGSATRKAEFSDGIAMVFSIATTTMTREAYITIPELPENIQFPRWHGIAIDIARLPVYGDEHYYVHFSQLPESEDYIFDIVVEDLRSAISELKSINDCIGTITEILAKWKRFFQSERPVVMPDEMQEGLFGELTFLEKTITAFGAQAVLGWVGGERETHDFYYSNNAVEVKATTRKEPYSVKISSEYQLDNTDVTGKLYLYAVALRKSRSSGEKIPEKVSAVRNLLESDYQMRSKFDEKVFKYGYVDGCEDQYTFGFHVRDVFLYEVQDGFPRIIRQMFGQGVSRVGYDINLSQCSCFACEETQLMTQLMRGGSHD